MRVMPFSLLCFFALMCEPLAADRPNVLLILTDDQGYGDLGIHGNPHLKTPHLDGLAKEGVQFERFYVNSFCAPTRAALLTGRYPLRCGVWGVTHNKEAMRPSEVTIAEALKTVGYRTACIGKWHNGEQFPYTPPGQGFDEFLGFCNGHANNYFDATLLRGSKPEKTQGYISDVLTDDAIRFIKANAKLPFFCYLSYNAPHSPYQVPDKYYDKYIAKGMPGNVAAFYGMCENIDDNVGRLLHTLDELKLTDNTIVLFLTDNGGTAGVKVYNAGMRGGKTSVHEGGCRVPLFVRWPARLKQPRVVKQICSHIDLYPTLLDMCKVEAPDGPTIDGISLRPLLLPDEEGKARDLLWPDRELFTHNPISATNRYPGAVRTQRYRLVNKIRGPQGGSSAKENDKTASGWQLYDMQNDPGEKRNIAKEHPQLVAQLSRRYEAWVDASRRQKLERCPIPLGHTEENPVTLNAPQAYFTNGLRFDHGPGFAHDWLTDWKDASSKVWFDIDAIQAGTYRVEVLYACPASKVKFQLAGGDQKFCTTVAAASAPIISLPNRDRRSNERYVNRRWGVAQLGELRLPAGRQRIELRTVQPAASQLLDFKALRLTRLPTEATPPR